MCARCFPFPFASCAFTVHAGLLVDQDVLSRSRDSGRTSSVMSAIAVPPALCAPSRIVHLNE